MAVWEAPMSAVSALFSEDLMNGGIGFIFEAMNENQMIILGQS
jgi:hypothetical protein